MVLDSDQFEVAGVVFGHGTPLQVDEFSLGDADIRTNDVGVAGGDGTNFGYDYHGGRTLTWEVFTDTGAAATSKTQAALLAAAWDRRTTRLTPRAVMPARLHVPGSGTVVVYGRPRRFTPAGLRGRRDGIADYVATFDTVHAAFFGDTEHEHMLALVPDLSGGLTLPAVLPAQLAAISTTDAAMVTNGGDADTWPVVTFTGPLTNPEITLLATGASIRLVTALAFDQSVTVDPRPWARTILRADGASLAGKARGVRLEELRLPPGGTEVAFRGQDETGNSSCVIRWRDGHTTP